MEGMTNQQANAMLLAIIQILRLNRVSKKVIDQVQRLANAYIGK